METENKKPVVSNYDGGCQVACWEKTSKDGKPFYQMTLQRKYQKDGQDVIEKIHLFPEQALQVAELLRVSYNDLMAYKYKQRKKATNQEPNPIKDAWGTSEQTANEPIDDEIPF